MARSKLTTIDQATYALLAKTKSQNTRMAGFDEAVGLFDESDRLITERLPIARSTLENTSVLIKNISDHKAMTDGIVVAENECDSIPREIRTSKVGAYGT